MAFHKININSTDFELAPKKVKSKCGDNSTNNNLYIPYLSNGPGFEIVDPFSHEINCKAAEILVSHQGKPGIDNPKFFYNPSQNAVGATKFIGDLEGNADSATNATYIRITDTEPTGSSTYYPTFVNGWTSGSNYNVRANDGLQYLTREGSTSQLGTAILAVGNNIAEGTAGNKQGCLRIYGNKTGFGNITGPESGNLTFYLPNTQGTFVTHATRGSAVGNASKPVYIASTGRATACSSTVGNASKPVYMNAGTITECTWGTTMTSGTYYYLMGTTGSTAGLGYNTNVKVLTNAIYASSGFYESSDERLKDFQEDIEVNFSYLHNIPKKYYSWKDDATYTRHIGTSAQEVQKYYPELVNVDENSYLTMNYDKLSIVALKAIDVLHEEVTELKKENAELKERLARLEELILNNR